MRILQLDFFKIFNVFKFQNAGFLKLTKIIFLLNFLRLSNKSEYCSVFNSTIKIDDFLFLILKNKLKIFPIIDSKVFFMNSYLFLDISIGKFFPQIEIGNVYFSKRTEKSGIVFLIV